MLFMVIESFRDLPQLAERFRTSGRMLPDGLTYHASWMDAEGTRCFQIMESADPDLLREWSSHWDDIVDFEIVPVLTSADFWARQPAG